METSAKTNINIESAFCELAEAILDKTAENQPTTGQGGVVNPSSVDPASSHRNCCST